MADHRIEIDIEKAIHTSNGVINLTVKTTIEEGELVALFGNSGAGKTTLLRILSGLIVPDRGVVRFGDSVWYDSEKRINLAAQKRNIGFMFQDYALFPNMTVEENILYAQVRKDREAVEELLSVFGLMELRRRKPQKLSGGQRQRVALARSLARRPKLLLLDEPLSALDSGMRVLLQDEIIKAHQYLGTTTLMVSHDLNEVFRLATHVLVIENGTITRTGTPESVFSDSTISGKVQINGQIARIEKEEIAYIVTVVTGNNQIIKVIAFDEDIEGLRLGDHVLVYSKAFNPIISKLEN